MITLYYVKGISRLDEPLFDTVAHQQAFFHKYAIAEVDTGFYPPHFQNQITISTDDASFDTSCNYLSLSYGTKNYYYFIDTITYVAEDVISLSVTMDTIQTFMFDCDFLSMKVNRLTIKRWEDPDNKIINRDYIRVNLSKGPFLRNYYSKTRDRLGWLLIWMRDGGNLYTTNSQPLIVVSYSEEETSVGAIRINKMPLCIPISLNDNIKFLYMVDANGKKVQAYDNSGVLSDQANVLAITYINYDLFQGLYEYEYSGDSLTLTMKGAYLQRTKELFINTGTGAGQITLAPIGIGVMGYTLPMLQRSSQILPYNLSFSVNTKKNSPRNSSYVPALLDENYVHISFGEQMNGTSYPLYLLTKPQLYGNILVDWTTNTRQYYLSQNEELGRVNDPYETLLILNTEEQYDLYNDAWNQYYSANSATWTIGYKLNKKRMLYSSLSAQFGNQIESIGALAGAYGSGTMSQKISPLAYGRSGKLLNTATQYYRDNWYPSENISGSAFGAGVRGIANNYRITTGYIENLYALEDSREVLRGNLYATPDTESQGNTVNVDRINGALDSVTFVDMVSDFETVCKDMELNGYDVIGKYEEINPFTFFNYRWYYNIVRADIDALNLKNVIGDESTISAIKSRFSAGLRLWNTDNGTLRARYLGDFQYDNVETAFIKE